MTSKVKKVLQFYNLKKKILKKICYPEKRGRANKPERSYERTNERNERNGNGAK